MGKHVVRGSAAVAVTCATVGPTAAAAATAAKRNVTVLLRVVVVALMANTGVAAALPDMRWGSFGTFGYRVWCVCFVSSVDSSMQRAMTAIDNRDPKAAQKPL